MRSHIRLRLLVVLPALLLASLFSHAQTYEPGLLVRSSGDTLRGEVENGFWIEPPTFIRFRPTPSSPSQLFQPRQLRAVSFTNGRYFRYEVLPIDHAAETRLDRLPQGYSPDVKIDSLLAEVLMEGPTLLLRVVRFSATHYLISRPNQPILDLSERKYLSPSPSDDGQMKITDGNNYRAQLSLYFGDCPAASGKAATAAFTPKGLAAVVQAYNATCTTGQPVTRTWLAQAAQVRRTIFRGGVLVGGRYLR